MMYSSVAIGSVSQSRLVSPNLFGSYQRPSSSTAKLAFQSLEMTHETDGMRNERVRRELRLAQSLLREGGEAEGPDRLGRGVGGDRDQLERAVEMETLVEAEVEVLPRLGLIREGRQIAEARGDGEIGREGLVVGRVDVLQAARRRSAGRCRRRRRRRSA